MDSSTAESQPVHNDHDIHSTSPRHEDFMHSEKLTIQTHKPFTTLSAIGIGYGTTNTAVGLLLVLGTTIPLGGSPLFFWGFLVMIIIALATATSLAELASAMPHAGGQYIWVSQLAPASLRRSLSYCTAMLSWLGAVATGASACLSVSTGVCGVVAFLKADFVYQRWMGFVGFQLLNLATVVCAAFEHALPGMSTTMLFFSCASCLAVVVALFATSREHVDARGFFFATVNTSGWQDGIGFLVGIGGINWSLCCLDVATHLAEEIPSPATNIPKALMWTVVVGALSGLLVIVAVFANLPVIDADQDNSAVALFYRISRSRALAVGILVPVLITTAGAVWSIQIWQSRIAWTISRDGGFPLRRHLARVLPAPFHTPLWSLVWSAACSALFGCLYLGSEVAFNSLIATGVLLLYFSYSIPVVLVLWQGRSTFAHGPFWCPVLGCVSNLVMLGWTLVAAIFYCFPYQSVVEPEKMNFVSVVLGVIALFICILWFSFASRHYDVNYDGH
ncbi:hypothetical protein E4U43_005636 [Claviceps pusilla]|uniref:Choline transport protein n=1 Tax=Claviceps pusilla TaxID=123648 RepID=A0A9P7SVC5_9HYPO|nr:hypothetical protein E4U43_005636 [Claviceps pusilla]